MGLPAGWTRHPWGIVDETFTPRADPGDAPPYTRSCGGKCDRCKANPCCKANGHTWGCNCHCGPCVPRRRADGSVYYGDEVPHGRP